MTNAQALLRGLALAFAICLFLGGCAANVQTQVRGQYDVAVGGVRR